jgi:hypothetical protein
MSRWLGRKTSLSVGESDVGWSVGCCCFVREDRRWGSSGETRIVRTREDMEGPFSERYWEILSSGWFGY